MRMAVSLPMTREEFDDDTQTLYRCAFAASAGVETSDVSVAKVTQIGSTNQRSMRRLMASSLRVDTSIRGFRDAAHAQAVATQLTANTINANLKKQGLPAVSILEAPTVAAVEVAPKCEGVACPNIHFILLAVGGVACGVVVLPALCVRACLKSDKQRSSIASVPRAQGDQEEWVSEHDGAWQEEAPELQRDTSIPSIAALAPAKQVQLAVYQEPLAYGLDLTKMRQAWAGSKHVYGDAVYDDADAALHDERKSHADMPHYDAASEMSDDLETCALAGDRFQERVKAIYEENVRHILEAEDLLESMRQLLSAQPPAEVP